MRTPWVMIGIGLASCALGLGLAAMYVVPTEKRFYPRVLFIGNSLTASNNLPEVVRAMVRSTGGDLRIAAVGAVGDAVTDAVVCGEGRDSVGLMFYPKPGHAPAEIAQAVRDGLQRLNAQAKGSGGKVARALVLDTPPDPHAGEITDKGYIAQALARSLRATDVERLFAEPAGPGVIVLS